MARTIKQAIIATKKLLARIKECGGSEKLDSDAKKFLAQGRQAYEACSDMEYRFNPNGKPTWNGYVYVMVAIDKDGEITALTKIQWTGPYVGETDDMVSRTGEHLSGHGCKSTKWALRHNMSIQLKLAIHTDDRKRLESILKRAGSEAFALLNGKVILEELVDRVSRMPNPTKASVWLRRLNRIKRAILWH